MRRSSALFALMLLMPACGDDDSAAASEAASESESGSESESPGETESGSEAETGTEVGTDSETDTDSETGEDPLESICASELSESITPEAIAVHLEALHAIAVANDGNRAAGTSGYEASAAYVEEQLADAGYIVTRWPFSFDRYVEFSPPNLATVADAPIVYQADQDYAVPNWSPAGSVSATIEAVDLDLGPGNQSTSGCEAEDFAGFTPGNIALIQRGTCTFVTKAQNAEAAGAVAVVLFNQGDSEARKGLFSGSLGSQNQLTAPILFTTYTLGAELADAAALATVTLELSIDAGTVATETFNVLAETPTGDPNQVIMLGAHLDSVPAGPGVNDNGSGTSTVLEIARQFAACNPNNKVRFAWWGAEEWGLHGSRQWVQALGDDELEDLALYLNFDMVASPNYVRYVHNGSGGPDGSTLLYDAFLEWFDSASLATSGAGFSGRSDYQAFVDAGVPAGGLATGAGESKSEAQAETYGGMAGQALDGCYHQACDDQANFDFEVLGQNGQAAGHVLQKWATGLGELARGREIVTVPNEVAAATLHECGHAHE